MLDRRSCERRVYRLATLLTGNPNAATRVIASVIDAQPDLRKLDSAHMDRLTVLRSREINPARIVAEDVPPNVAQGLQSLNPQQREAWIFARLYQLDEREAARAMDCSTAAIRLHLEKADELMSQALGRGLDEAVEILRRYSMALEVPAFHRRDQIRRRRWRQARQIVLLIVILAGIVAVVIAWPWIVGQLDRLG